MLEVERGNDVTLLAAFSKPPASVYFSYIRPCESRAVVDPGYGSPESKIRYVGVEGDAHLYAYVVDTTEFRGGEVKWHFWGTGGERCSAFGEFRVVDRPAQLL